MRGVLLAAVLVVAATLAAVVAGSATAAAPTGTWELIPAQTSTAGTPETTTDTTTAYAYKTAVRPPINADGSSVFSVKRGVVPVQFDVLAAPTTTTTTTTTTPHTWDPIVFESIGSDGFYPGGVQQTDDWSALVFTPTAGPMTFADVQSLISTYDFTTGTCHGGSLRWTINVQHNGVSQNVHVYYGVPNGPDQGCTVGAADGSGENLMDDSTAVTNDRFEYQSAGTPVYTTYAAMLAKTNNGADPVNWIGLILDSGWGGDQVIDPTTLAASVNGNAWGGANSGTFDTTVTGDPVTTTGDFAKTCDIPQAAINVVKAGQTTSPLVNETVDSVQPKDTGDYFRNVDCKLIYNLDVSTLDGVGNYTVSADFGAGPVNDPALFGLK
jgi:hypothetical protein